jgi:hypothetical protein
MFDQASNELIKVRKTEPTLYDPVKGLKEIAVAEAGEKHWRRAKDATKLFAAVEAKIDAQADYVVWRDRIVVPSQAGRAGTWKTGPCTKTRFTRWRPRQACS